MEDSQRFLFCVTDSDLPSQFTIPTPRTSPGQDDRPCLRGESREGGRGLCGPGGGPLASSSLAELLPGAAGSPSGVGAAESWTVGRGRSPQASHKSQLCGQGAGVGRGQGAAPAAHTGQGREARVRCGCKSSPKCLQGKANQGAVTEHTRPHPAQWARSGLCKHMYTYRYKNTPLHVPYTQLCTQNCHTHT